MTAVVQPTGLARVSRIPHQLLTWGVPMGPLMLLQTRGRRSGLPRAIPVVVLRHGSEEWLVCPFGATQWVHNVRANGVAELGRGRRSRTVRLVEIHDDRKPDVLHSYRRTFGFVPFVRRAFTAAPGDGPSAFQPEADRHPVFLVQPA
jgi:deazaflavin-dependent oxidoreductase (nitroreductase family)